MDPTAPSGNLARLPAVDQVLGSSTGRIAEARFGHTRAVAAIRRILEARRMDIRGGGQAETSAEAVARAAHDWLEAADLPRAREVFNLTGTVLHTNLGRALLAEEAIEAATAAMRAPVALEFDLETGRRGERDSIVRDLLVELTGAEDATVVNNNAAAVLIVLNTLAAGRETIVSRGELIEIGGAFRMPDIMARAGTRLVEIGTTNRTHPKDYAGAIGPETALLMKVHTSNYRIEGFTKAVPAAELSRLAKDHDVPLVDDLGSGTLLDLSRFGMAKEPTVAEAVAAGADLVTFSGDKLLGGPQAGFVVGRKELIARINKNPMKRAMRLDKIRLAALEATLKLYLDPARLAGRLPTLRLLTRKEQDIEEQAKRLHPVMAAAVGPEFDVSVIACSSQIGSGSLPLETLKSAALAVSPIDPKASGHVLNELAARFRRLPCPVIGRVSEGALQLDLRCLEDEAAFLANLEHLGAGG